MNLYALAHPIDGDKFPDQAPGFRWAVYAGDEWNRLDDCLGAGWAPSMGAASSIADQAAACVGNALRKLRLPVGGCVATNLDYDPIDVDNDLLKIG